MHTVLQGETLQSIALDRGLSDWRDILDAPENADFKAKCDRGERDPFILYPGETLFVPNRLLRHDPAAVDSAHTYRVKPPPTTKLRVVLESPDGTPIADQEWTLTVDGKTFTGTTGADGVMQAEVPVKAKRASVKVRELTWDLQVGGLNPLDPDVADGGISGAQQRLANLGYAISAIDGQLNEETGAALKSFQAAAEIQESGTLDDATRAAFVKLYGC